MGAVKIRTSDQIFSRCVRERSGWKCERCGAQHEEGSQGLHCSHFHGRGKWGVRFNPLNTSSHCMGCHLYFGANPSEHAKWMEEKLGPGMLQILQEMANDTTLGRLAKRSEKEIRAHYRAELARMKQLRANGETGWIDFENWI